MKVMKDQPRTFRETICLLSGSTIASPPSWPIEITGLIQAELRPLPSFLSFSGFNWKFAPCHLDTHISHLNAFLIQASHGSQTPLSSWLGGKRAAVHRTECWRHSSLLSAGGQRAVYILQGSCRSLNRKYFLKAWTQVPILEDDKQKALYQSLHLQVNRLGNLNNSCHAIN